MRSTATAPRRHLKSSDTGCKTETGAWSADLTCYLGRGMRGFDPAPMLIPTTRAVKQTHRGYAMKLLRALSLSIATLACVVSQPALADPQRAQVDELKTVYLTCEQAASRTILDMAAAAFCSRYAEELLRRGFAGDFNQLLAWWREARNEALAAGGGKPDPTDDRTSATTH